MKIKKPTAAPVKVGTNASSRCHNFRWGQTPKTGVTTFVGVRPRKTGVTTFVGVRPRAQLGRVRAKCRITLRSQKTSPR